MNDLVRLADAVEVDDQVAALAGRIAAGHAETAADDLVMVGILTGGVVLLADLVRHLRRHVVVDFLALTSPGGAPASERRRAGFAMDLATDVVDRHVVLVDDLLDSGVRAAGVVEDMHLHGAASVEVVSLLDRPAGRLVEVPLLGAAFEVGDERFVGSGLDLDGWFRSLPGLWRIIDEAAPRREPARVLERVMESLAGSPDEPPSTADPGRSGT